jgi:DNA (cytosine-5)-methyltransferase 1
MRHGSLFSGIGGFDLASEWMGWENVFHCEWNEFGQKVLKYYWPKAISYHDITKTDFSVHRGTIDIITGGFPCQPYSMAGKRLGKEDERHLWPEMLRAIREIQPTWVVGENVLGLVNWNGGLVFEEVQAELEAQGYEVQPYVLPAASVNAPHKRDRVWFVAYSDNKGRSSGLGQIQSKDGEVSQWDNNAKSCDSNFRDKKNIRGWDNFPTVSPICSRNDGLSDRLDGITFSKWRQESIKAGGNAIVPQVVYQIFKAIEQYETTR